MAAPVGSLKRQAGLKPAEKAKLLVEYAQLPADKVAGRSAPVGTGAGMLHQQLGSSCTAHRRGVRCAGALSLPTLLVEAVEHLAALSHAQLLVGTSLSVYSQLVNCVCAQFQAFQRSWRRSTQSPEMSTNSTYRS